MAAPDALHINQAGIFEDLQVMRDRLLTSSAPVSNLSHRQRVATNKAKDLLSLWGSQCCEDLFGRHGHHHDIRLLNPQAITCTSETQRVLCTSNALCIARLTNIEETTTMDMREINKGVIAEFRQNDGKLSGPMEGAPILLLTTTGRISGGSHTTPVGFIDAGGRIAVVAANGGSDEHPDWYLNIEQRNEVTIEVPGAAIPSIAVVADGSEREDLLRTLAESLPGMSDHISATSRQVPVVIFSEAK
jgi:deazaflavin-dependent oxidoreductase (nitroreductase family)